MKNREEIGVAVINYDTEGKPRAVRFTPLIKIDTPMDLLNQHENVKGKDEQQLKTNAELAMGSWFAKVDSIELADRDKYKITSEVKCFRREDDSIRQCEVTFFFEEM